MFFIGKEGSVDSIIVAFAIQTMINSRNIVYEGEEEAEEDWGVVSLDGDNPPENETTNGELILSGDDASSSFRHENNNPHLTADDISIPRTDSIPSEIDTLDICSGLNVNNSTGGSDATWRPEDEEQSVVAHSTTRSYMKIRAIMVSALVMMTLLGYLAWERHSWRMAHMRVVEEKLRLEEENRHLKEQAAKGAKHPSKSRSCNTDAWQEESDDAVLADNCYFRLTLRDCGKNVRESWNDLTNGVYSSFDYFGKMAWNAVWQQDEDSGSTSKMNSMATEGLSEASVVMASTVLAVNNAVQQASESTRVAVTNVFNEMSNVFHDMSKVVDESILRVVDLTRDAIDDAAASTRPE